MWTPLQRSVLRHRKRILNATCYAIGRPQLLHPAYANRNHGVPVLTRSTAGFVTRSSSFMTLEIKKFYIVNRVSYLSSYARLISCVLIILPQIVLQLRTNKVINFDNLRTRIFIKILTSDSESETLKLFKKGASLIFPHFFGVAKFLGIFNPPKSLANPPSLDQFCTLYDPDVVDV